MSVSFKAGQQAFGPPTGSRRVRLLVAALLLVPLLAGCASRDGNMPVGCDSRADVAAPGPGEDITFATGDGVMLHGTYWRGVDGRHAAVLVHGLGEDQDAWEPLAEALRHRGFAVLSFDLRGHGASTQRDGAAYAMANFTSADFQAMQQDVAAAVEVARGRATQPGCIALVGASLGANLALRVMAEKPEVVTAAALLSPGREYRNVSTVDVLPRVAEKPLLLVASVGDAYAYESTRGMASEAPKAEVSYPDGAAHGTNLLGVAGVKDAVVAWLARSA